MRASAAWVTPRRWPIMRSPGSRARSVDTCQVLRPRRAVRVLAMARPSVLPSTLLSVSAPGTKFFSRLNGWPVSSPVNASPCPSRATAHELGVDADRYSFIVMDLHHLLLAGFAGALATGTESRVQNSSGGNGGFPDYFSEPLDEVGRVRDCRFRALHGDFGTAGFIIGYPFQVICVWQKRG